MTRGFSWVVLALGLLAAAGIGIGIARSSDGPLALASCSSFGTHVARGAGPGC